MRCWGCRKHVKDGAWFFTDAPPGRSIALCEPCHEDSAPTKARREWKSFGTVRSVQIRFLPKQLPRAHDGLVNDKPIDV